MAIRIRIRIRIRDPDPYLYCDTGKTCLGEGMHCLIASSVSSVALFAAFLFTVYYQLFIVLFFHIFVGQSQAKCKFTYRIFNKLLIMVGYSKNAQKSYVLCTLPRSLFVITQSRKLTGFKSRCTTLMTCCAVCSRSWRCCFVNG